MANANVMIPVYAIPHIGAQTVAAYIALEILWELNVAVMVFAVVMDSALVQLDLTGMLVNVLLVKVILFVLVTELANVMELVLVNLGSRTFYRVDRSVIVQLTVITIAHSMVFVIVGSAIVIRVGLYFLIALVQNVPKLALRINFVDVMELVSVNQDSKAQIVTSNLLAMPPRAWIVSNLIQIAPGVMGPMSVKTNIILSVVQTQIQN